MPVLFRNISLPLDKHINIELSVIRFYHRRCKRNMLKGGLGTQILKEQRNRKMERKGFTLIELFVIISLLALLAFFLFIFPDEHRQIDSRMICGTNLSGLGKAMMVYANDYDDEYPRAGGPTSVWARSVRKWDADNRFDAYSINQDGSGGQATISSCLYLLVKYAEVKPKSFICKGDSGVKKFRPAKYGARDRDLIELWDFGPPLKTERHVSYSYHTPFNQYALTAASEPGIAVAADRNPWITNKAAKRRNTWDDYNPDGGYEGIMFGNSISHKGEGQNVLFMDGSMRFVDRPFCGINDDNIYTYQDGGDIRRGVMPEPAVNTTVPADGQDSLVVHDGEKSKP